MPTYKNPSVLQGKAVPLAAGLAVVNREVFDVANASYKPASLVNGDRIQIGVVPAGCKLVSHLSLIRIPILDTNGVPTGSASLGTNTTPAALRATAVVNAAQVISGEDFTTATSDIGAKDVDVPLYAVFTANVATLAVTGKIISDVVVRPYDSNVDTDVT